MRVPIGRKAGAHTSSATRPFPRAADVAGACEAARPSSGRLFWGAEVNRFVERIVSVSATYPQQQRIFLTIALWMPTGKASPREW